MCRKFMASLFGRPAGRIDLGPGEVKRRIESKHFPLTERRFSAPATILSMVHGGGPAMNYTGNRMHPRTPLPEPKWR